jgi:hypothetical protein
MILSPASEKWRGAYYACRICKQDADFICARGLTPICTNCKACYVGIFGYEALKIMRGKKEKLQRKLQYQHDEAAKAYILLMKSSGQKGFNPV